MRRYYSALRRKLKRCKSVACRRRFFHRFRVDLESRHIALLRQLADQARAKLELDVRACRNRADFSEDNKKACVAVVTNSVQARLNHLTIRQLTLGRRRDLRECDFVSDPVACKAKVNAEYVAEMSKYTITAVPNGPAGRAASGSILTAGVVLSISVILAVIVF